MIKKSINIFLLIILFSCNRESKQIDNSNSDKEDNSGITLSSSNLLGIACSNLSSENAIKSIKYINAKDSNMWFELSIDTILNYSIDRGDYKAVIFVNELYEKINDDDFRLETHLVGCHSCGPKTNCLLLIKGMNDTWMPFKYYEDFKGSAGTFGKSCDFIIRQFGKNKYCIGSDWAFSGQGYIEYGQYYTTMENKELISIRKSINLEGYMNETTILYDGNAICGYDGDFDIYMPDSNSSLGYSDIYVYTNDKNIPKKTIKNNLNVYDVLTYSNDSNKYVAKGVVKTPAIK